MQGIFLICKATQFTSHIDWWFYKKVENLLMRNCSEEKILQQYYGNIMVMLPDQSLFWEESFWSFLRENLFIHHFLSIIIYTEKKYSKMKRVIFLLFPLRKYS